MDNNRMTMDNELRIVQGNTFATAIEIHAVDATGQPIVDWSLEDSTDIRVWYVFAGREQDITTWQIDDGKLVILWLANMQRVGTYDIFCAGKYNGADWRNAMQYQFRIVRFNHEANIPANVVILDGIYQLSAELQIITQFAGGGGTPSQTLPLMDGEASVGTEDAYARGDHRHPSDTSKQDVIDDLTAIRSGAAAGARAYQKPSTGIPKTDMAPTVQTSLEKAGTALQPSDIVDSLSSESTTSPLSANQGKMLNEEVSQLEQEVDVLEQYIKADDFPYAPVWARPGKYIALNGSVSSSGAWSISAPFTLPKGITIRVKSEGSGATIIASTTDGTSYNPLVVAPSGISGLNTYEYTAEAQDETIAISAKVGNNNVEISTHGEGIVSHLYDDMNGGFRVLAGAATGTHTLTEHIMPGEILQSIVFQGNNITLIDPDNNSTLVFLWELPYVCTFEVSKIVIYNSSHSAFSLTIKHPGVKELAYDTSRFIDDTIEPGVRNAISCKGIASELYKIFKFARTEKTPVSTATGYSLYGNGLCVSDQSSKLVKYGVSAGDIIYLSLSKDNRCVYQFQSSASVPTSTQNTSVIGKPVTDASDGIVVVPENATYLIVSQLNTNNTNVVYSVDTAIHDDEPEYVQGEKERVYDLLINRSNGDVHIAAFSTDQHFDLDRIVGDDSYDPKWVMQGVSSLLDIANELPIDQIVFGGDVAGYGGVTSSDVAGILKTIAYLLKPTHDTNSVVISIPGNHDAYQNNAGVTAQGMHAVNAKRNERHLYYHGNGTDNCDAYWDDVVHNIRSIYIDTYSQNTRTEDFRAFLTSALSSLPASYMALIFSHNPLTNEFAGIVKAQKISDPSVTIDAFQDPSDCHSILNTYADKIIACINGHTHFDAWAVSSSNILYIETTTAAPHTRNYTFENIPNTSTLGTVTDTSYDFFVIDQNDKTIEALRYGQGCNRKWVYKGSGIGQVSGYPQTIVR